MRRLATRTLHCCFSFSHLPLTPPAENVPSLHGKRNGFCRRLRAEVNGFPINTNFVSIHQHTQRQGGKTVDHHLFSDQQAASLSRQWEEKSILRAREKGPSRR